MYKYAVIHVKSNFDINILSKHLFFIKLKKTFKLYKKLI